MPRWCRFCTLVAVALAGSPLQAQPQPRQVLKGHKHTITCLAFSSAVNQPLLLASGSKDGTVRIWDADNDKLLHVLEGHRDMVVAVAFSPDNKLLAATSHDTAIKIWDTATGKEARSLKGHTKDVRGVAFSPDGKTLASAGMDGLVLLWDTTTWEVRKTCKGHTAEVNFVTFSRDGKTLASGGWDKTVRLWDPTTGKSLGVLEGHTNMVRDAVFSPDGRTLYSSGKDGMIRAWKDGAAEPLYVLDGHDGNLVRSLAISKGGSILVSASRDGTLNIWDLGKRKVLYRFHEGVLSFQVVALSRDGVLATGGIDRNVTLFEMITLNKSLRVHQLLTPVEARKQIGKEITVELTVRATKDRLEKRKEIYLDSEDDFRDPKNFAIVINVQGAAKLKEKGVDDPATYYKGKTIRVRGLVRVVDDIPRILVENAEQITVYGK